VIDGVNELIPYAQNSFERTGFFRSDRRKYWMMGAFGLGALLLSVLVFLMFAGVAVAATRLIETCNLRLEDIAR
jgi:hypothetical protein